MPRITRRSRTLLILLPLLLIAGGCRSALREPRPLSELAGAGDRLPVATASSRAAELFAKRHDADASSALDAAREAAQLWQSAAAAEPESVEWLAAATRASIWLAGREPEAAARRDAAERAVETGQWCRRAAVTDPRCAYWLALALGAQARERSSTGLDALPRIVALLQQALDGDPELDNAGPQRALALVYARAPGWPTGPGDPDLALEHAEAAVELRPGHPPNLLALAEALEGIEEPEQARDAYARARQMAQDQGTQGVAAAGRWLAEAEKALDRLGPEGS